MSAWTVGLILGAVVVALIVGLCVFVLRAVAATAAASQQLAEVLHQVQANTAVLSDLDRATSSIQGAAQRITTELDGQPADQNGRRSPRR